MSMTDLTASCSAAEDAPYHFEFTQKQGHKAGRAPTKDNLIVFYIPGEADWKAQTARLEAAGHAPVPPFNSYWDQQGRTYEDPDGYRVVIWRGQWGVAGVISEGPADICK